MNKTEWQDGWKKVKKPELEAPFLLVNLWFGSIVYENVPKYLLYIS